MKVEEETDLIWLGWVLEDILTILLIYDQLEMVMKQGKSSNKKLYQVHYDRAKVYHMEVIFLSGVTQKESLTGLLEAEKRVILKWSSDGCGQAERDSKFGK